MTFLLPRPHRALGAAAVLHLGLLAGCGSDFDGYSQAWQTMPPVALDHNVAYVERTTATAFVIDPADPALRPNLVGVGKKATLAVRRNGQDQLLVLAQGERGEGGVAPEDPSLTVVPGVATQPARRIKLGARFNAFAQSEDGRFGVCHFTQAGRDASQVLFNPNEIAVVDFSAAEPTAVGRTLRSFGSVPLAVTFSPQLTLPGEGRPLRLGVALSDGYVTLFDLEHGDRAEITVSLTLPDDQRMLRPLQVLFEQQDPTKEPTVFVRASGANDVFALRVVPVPAAERAPQGNDFRPVLSLLGIGGPPSDMQVFASPEGPRLLVVAPGRSEALIIDPSTSRTTTLKLGLAATRIQLFEAAAPGQPQVRPRALLVPMSGAAQLAFLDLDQVEELRSRNLDVRTMGAAAEELLPSLDRGLVIVEHGNSSGVSVIDLARRTIAPLVVDFTQEVALAPAPSTKLWLGSRMSLRVGYVNLPGLSVGDLTLDAPARALLPLGPSPDGKRRVVVDHEHGGGRITVLDADDPRRATARAVTGFLYTDLLQRRVP